MYLVNFCKSFAKKENIPVILYLVLNVALIGVVVGLLFRLPFWLAVLIGLGVYALSLAIALSPAGEWILRTRNGCKRITRKDQLDYLMPLFQEVYDKARQRDPGIPEDIGLYIKAEQAPNAFATGRKTVCVTEGLLHQPENRIKATLAHEFGHLSHHDTDIILLVSVGNLIVNVIILGIRAFLGLIRAILMVFSLLLGGPRRWFGAMITSVFHVLTAVLVTGLSMAWTKLGTILVMKTSRSNEYRADAFAAEMGYGMDLCALLDDFLEECPEGLFAALASTHPEKSDRIARLQAMGVPYRVRYGDAWEPGQTTDL